MPARLFTVFHQAVDLRLIFPSFSDQEISRLVRLYAVAERYPGKRVVLKDGRQAAARDLPDIIFEQDLPHYDPRLQARGFMETSAYIHILKNGLHLPYDHVAISQYDMRWTNEAVARLGEITETRSPMVGAMILGNLMDRTGELHPLAFPRHFNWDFLLSSYNRHFGTDWELRALMNLPLTLFQIYVLSRNEFVVLAGWLEKLCEQVWPWANQAPYPAHWGVLGGYTERAQALFIALRFRAGHFGLRHLPVEHDPAIPMQLGIAKKHYG